MVRIVYPRAAHIIAVSEGVVDDLAANFGVARARMSAIANPVDHRRIAELAAEPPAFVPADRYIVSAGRLMPNKNFPAPSARLCAGFAARTSRHTRRRARARRASSTRRLAWIADRVDMPGFVASPFAVVARAQAYAMPSNAEGFPNGLVEAMACGIPVVATNCASGPSEILAGRSRDAISGRIDVDAGALVPTDDVEAFAAALVDVLAEPRRSACGAKARRALAGLWRRTGGGKLLGADRGGAARAVRRVRNRRHISLSSGSKFMKWHMQIALAGALIALGGCAGQTPLAGSGAAPPPRRLSSFRRATKIQGRNLWRRETHRRFRGFARRHHRLPTDR